jgi:hypothetical protein
LFSPIGDRDRVIREEADAVKWFTQLVGKLKSIGGSKQAKDTTATAPAEPVEEAKDTAATTTEPAEKADAADAAQEKTETTAEAPAEAAADTETVVATEEAAEETPAATAEPVEEKTEKTDSAEAEPAPVAAAAEPADDTETVAVSEEAAAAVVAEAESAAKAAPEPADPALSTLDEGAITAELKATSGPYGPGSAKPAADGAAPSAEFAVKGKESSKLFHTEKSPYFGRTKADVWFKTEADAEGAGFQAWDHKKRAAAKK